MQKKGPKELSGRLGLRTAESDIEPGLRADTSRAGGGGARAWGLGFWVLGLGFRV